jgi:hypothetical protein
MKLLPNRGLSAIRRSSVPGIEINCLFYLGNIIIIIIISVLKPAIRQLWGQQKKINKNTNKITNRKCTI